MRIIAGECRGRTIETPKGLDTRPTLDRVRESLFGILQFRVIDKNVLDLFAGSGSLGLEALSRGAKSAVFNDFSKDCALLVKKNAEKLGLLSRAEITSLDYAAALRQYSARGKRFHIAFLDPPYASNAAQEAAEMLFSLRLMEQDGVVVIEHNEANPPKPKPGLMKITDSRKYGYAHLAFLEREAED